jgi:hypothetical protein
MLAALGTAIGNCELGIRKAKSLPLTPFSVVFEVVLLRGY